MEIHNGVLFWPTTYTRKPHENPLIQPFYDAVIVGGGISGILTARALLQEGLSVALLDKRQPGEGSSAVNTGLLQYSNDIMLHDLIEQIGEIDAVRFYQLCFHAVKSLGKIAHTLDGNADFIERPSICFASNKKDIYKLQKEYETLRKYGLPCEYWSQQDIYIKLGIEKPAALVTYNDAEFNPYKFVIQLEEQLITQGLDVFDNTMLNIIEKEADNFVLHTIEGVFRTKRLIYTTGYEKLPFDDVDGTDIRRSYAIVTNVIPDFVPWHERAMIWETARPYFYLRTTIDNRIVIGGLDEGKSKPPKNSGKLVKHAETLLDVLHDLFPHYEVGAEFLYGASFGESKDNLPFIGEHPNEPNHYYLLGYGGNGTVYSMLGAQILADLIMGRKNDDARIVTMKRKYGL